MHDIYFWIAFFGPPLFIVLLTAFVFRPSARQKYHEAKQVIFTDDEMAKCGGKSEPNRNGSVAA